MKLTYNDMVQIERDLGSRSFAHFVRMAWPIIEPATRLKWGWAMDAICDHLQAVAEGKFNRLLMNVPPGTSKSTLTGVMWPAWCWTRPEWKHRRFLGTAHSDRLAIRDNLKCRRIIQSAWYQERWPTPLMSDNNAKLRFENENTGFREAMPFTSLTGSRGDALIIDDPLSVDHANSDAHLEDADITFREAVPTRINDEQESAIVVMMQRLNERDTSGIIIKDFPEYVHLCLPMEFEPDRRCVTPIFTDPRTEEGELLFPERFPADTVERLKRSLGSYGTAGQLQQRPTIRGGGIFKDEWWKYYSWEHPPKCQWRAIYVDTAQKTKQHNDFSAFELWGKTEDGQAVLLDLVHGKWEAPELIVQGRAFWNKHKAGGNGHLRAMRVEDKVSGTTLIQTLKREGIPITEIQRNIDKYSRGMDVAPIIESGNAIIPRDAPFTSKFLTETAAFNGMNNGVHDDMVDPMIDALVEIVGSKKISILDYM